MFSRDWGVVFPYGHLGFPGSSDGKEFVCSKGDLGSIPGLGRSPGEENGYPLQYSGLENCMGRGAWQATVHGVAKSQTWLSDFHYAYGHLDTPAPFLKRLSFSFLNYVRSNWPSALFLTLYSVPLIFMTILMPIPHSLDNHRFTGDIKIRWYRSFIFFPKVASAILSILHFHINFRRSLSISKKKKKKKYLLGFHWNCLESIGQREVD